MKKVLFFAFLLISISAVTQQATPPSEEELMTLSLDSLRTYIDETFDNDLALTRRNSNILLKSSRFKKDKTFIASSYLFLIMSSENDDISLMYCDSLIDFTKDFDNHKYPALAYSMKAEILYNMNLNRQALSQALIAHEKITSNTKPIFSHLIEQSIAHLASNSGQHDLANSFYLKSLNFFKTYDEDIYFNSLYGLAENHLVLKNLDSTSKYIKIGYKDAPKTKTLAIALFQISEGKLTYMKGNYAKAKNIFDSSIETLKTTDEQVNLAISYFWRGKTEQKLSSLKASIPYYFKVDSLFEITGSVPLEIRPAWTNIIKYFNKNGNVDQELLFARKLISVDSIIDQEYFFINSNITNEVILPTIDKENAIAKSIINKKNTLQSNWLIALGSLLFISLLSFFIYRKGQQKKFKQYKKVLSNLENDDSSTRINKASPSLKPDLVELIEKNLIQFESSQGYLDSKTTLHSTAKIIGTNPKYLSSYINHFKEVRFSDYLNNLRIVYILHRLGESVNKKKDPIRLWAMNDVAKAAGFGSREYYSKAFYKYTKMKHLDYIKQLEKEAMKDGNS